MRIEIFDSDAARSILVETEDAPGLGGPGPHEAAVRLDMAMSTLSLCRHAPSSSPTVNELHASRLAAALVELYGQDDYYLVAALTPARVSVFKASMEPVEVVYLENPDRGD